MGDLATAVWIGIAVLCVISSLVMLIQGRDKYGNDGCACDSERMRR